MRTAAWLWDLLNRNSSYTASTTAWFNQFDSDVWDYKDSEYAADVSQGMKVLLDTTVAAPHFLDKNMMTASLGVWEKKGFVCAQRDWFSLE